MKMGVEPKSEIMCMFCSVKCIFTLTKLKIIIVILKMCIVLGTRFQSSGHLVAG